MRKVFISNEIKVAGVPTIIEIDGEIIGTLNDVYKSQDDNKVSTIELVEREFNVKVV